MNQNPEILATCDLCGEEIIKSERGWSHRKRYHLHKARPRRLEPEPDEPIRTPVEDDDVQMPSMTPFGMAMAAEQVAELASSFTPDPDPEPEPNTLKVEELPSYTPAEPEPQRDYSPPISPEPAVDLPSIELEAPEPSCTGMDSSDSSSSGTDCSCDCSSSSDSCTTNDA